MTFIRKGPVDISKYLPDFMSKSEEYKSGLDAESEEHERMREELLDVSKQFNVNTAEWGLHFWEGMLGITPENTDIQQRRNDILARLNNTEVVTRKFMEGIINKYIEGKGGLVSEEIADYTVDFTIPLGKVTNEKGLFQGIETYIPAHLGKKLRLRDNIASRIFCETSEFDREKLTETFMFNGTADFGLYVAIAEARLLAKEPVRGVEFHDEMGMKIFSFAVCSEFDREVLMNGN